MKKNLVGGINISPKQCSVVLIDISEKLVHQAQLAPYYDGVKEVLQPFSAKIRGLAVCGSNAHGGLAEYLIDSGYKTYLISRSKLPQQPDNSEKRAFDAASLLREMLVILAGNVKQNKPNLPKLLGKSVLSDLNKLPITTFLTRL